MPGSVASVSSISSYNSNALLSVSSPSSLCPEKKIDHNKIRYVAKKFQYLLAKLNIKINEGNHKEASKYFKILEKTYKRLKHYEHKLEQRHLYQLADKLKPNIQDFKEVKKLMAAYDDAVESIDKFKDSQQTGALDVSMFEDLKPQAKALILGSEKLRRELDAVSTSWQAFSHSLKALDIKVPSKKDIINKLTPVFFRLYQDSYPDGKKRIKKQEQGGLIYYNCVTNSIELERAKPNGDEYGITLSKSNAPQAPQHCILIGTCHTHPSSHKHNFPSEEDLSNGKTRKVPGFVITSYVSRTEAELDDKLDPRIDHPKKIKQGKDQLHVFSYYSSVKDITQQRAYVDKR